MSFVKIKKKAVRMAFAVVGSLFLGSARLNAQEIKLYDNIVQPLSFWQGISFRVNALDWLALTPNLGMEFTLGNHNWNKYTLGFYGRANWNTASNSVPYNVYDYYDGRAELRRYWHGRNPRRVFYVGVYGGVNKFDVKLSATGRKGNGFLGGLTAGTVIPLYAYRNGGKLDFEMGVSVGALLAKYDEYVRQTSADGYDSYVITKPSDGYGFTFNPLLYALGNDVIRIGFVYHFGCSVADRYKRRVAIDDDYRYALQTRVHERDSLRNVRQLRKDTLRQERQQRQLERRAAKVRRQEAKAELRAAKKKAREQVREARSKEVRRKKASEKEDK